MCRSSTAVRVELLHRRDIGWASHFSLIADSSFGWESIFVPLGARASRAASGSQRASRWRAAKAQARRLGALAATAANATRADLGTGGLTVGTLHPHVANDARAYRAGTITLST
jgi:hypothetical protein